VSRRLDWENANRKDVVHEQGAEPVWHDFPEEAPAWVRRGSPPRRISSGDAGQGGP
jgi:hypothetical protein